MTAKKRKSGNGRKPVRTGRLNLMIDPKLKKQIHSYARRHHKSVSSIITDHFLDLIEKEKGLDVEQI